MIMAISNRFAIFDRFFWKRETFINLVVLK